MKLKKNKKSQVTVFIIAGIVILMAVGTYLALRRAEVSDIVGDGTPTIDEIPVEIMPIRTFVEGCVNTLAVDALKKLGTHGGYIDPYDSSLSGKTFTFNLIHPTESQLVDLGGGKFIPYWFYLKSKNTGNPDNMEPSLDRLPLPNDIEKQINLYVERNLQSCLESFEIFKRQGFIIDIIEEPKAKTTITEQDVTVLLNYEIETRKEGRRTNIKQYFTRVPLNFRSIYQAAFALTYMHVSTQFLEHLTMHILNPYMSIDGPLPPMSGTEKSFTSKIWVKYIVEQKIKELLTTFIPITQIAGTRNAIKMDTGLNAQSQGFYNTFFINLFDIMNLSFPRLNFDFMYLEWPIYLDINSGTSSKSALIKPTKTKYTPPIPPIPSWQDVDYRFYYDISYPVVVEIRDSDAFVGSGYSFIFALEVNIRDNKDIGSWFVGQGSVPWNAEKNIALNVRKPSEGSAQATTFLAANTPEGADLDILDITIEDFSFPSPEYTPKFFCNEDQRKSGDITIKTIDARTNEPLPGVDISYACGNYASCTFDETLLNTTYDSLLGEINVAEITSKFPTCKGGVLIFGKQGYQKKYLDLTIRESDSKNITVFLEPIRTKDLTVKKIECKHNAKLVNVAKTENIWRSPISGADPCYSRESCKSSSDWDDKYKKHDDGYAEKDGSKGYYLDCDSITKKTVGIDTWNGGKQWLCSCTSRHTKVVGDFSPEICDTNPKLLESSDTAIITITKQKDHPMEEDMTQFFKVTGVEDLKVNLVPGRYDISITYLYEDGVVLDKCMRICEEGDKPGVCCDAADMWIPDNVDIKPAPLGGVELTENWAYLVTKEALDAAEVLELKLFRLDDPFCLEDMEELNKVREYSTQYYPELATPSLTTDGLCTDTDNGLDYFVKGTCTVESGAPNTDYCIDFNTLKEYRCPLTLKFSCDSIDKKCAIGCFDGRCIDYINIPNSQTSYIFVDLSKDGNSDVKIKSSDFNKPLDISFAHTSVRIVKIDKPYNSVTKEDCLATKVQDPDFPNPISGYEFSEQDLLTTTLCIGTRDLNLAKIGAVTKHPPSVDVKYEYYKLI